MKVFSLPARTLLLWRLRLVAVGVPTCLAATYLCLYSVYFAAAAGILSAAVLFLWFFYLPRLWRSYKFEVDADCISVRCGVFIETERLIARKRIISCKMLQTPLCRGLLLYKITFIAARTRISLAPVDSKTAEWLRKL